MIPSALPCNDCEFAPTKCPAYCPVLATLKRLFAEVTR